MVGGGSYNWCPRLLCDLVQCPELQGSEVVLLDPNLEAAGEVQAAMDRVCADNNKSFKFIATSNEDEGFRDADFVIQTSLNDLVFAGAASKFNSPKLRDFPLISG